MRTSKKTSPWSMVYLVLVLLFIYAPILFIIVFSFNDGASMSNWKGFSLRWYDKLFHDPIIIRATGVTLVVGVLSAFFATVLGTFGAIGIHSMTKKKRFAVMSITQLPVYNPDLITGISLMLVFNVVKELLSRMGITMQLGFGTMLIAHITFNIPYVILSVLPRLKQSSSSLYEAALDLGASPSYALWKVTIPDIMPGIITGAILAFTMSLDDFVVTFFTRQGIQNLSTQIYATVRRGISPEINALSAIMFVVVLTLLLVVNIRGSREDNKMKKRKNLPKSAEVSPAR